MPRINLLPWREELRVERQQQFYVGLGVSAAIGIGTAYAGYAFVQGMIDHQNARNNYLRDEITLVDEKIKEINELQATKQRLIARMQIIEQLQTARPEIVHLFDEMVRTLPEGAYLNYIKQTFTKMLLSIHHHRITYPDLKVADGSSPEAAEPADETAADSPFLAGRRASS